MQVFTQVFNFPVWFLEVEYQILSDMPPGADEFVKFSKFLIFSSWKGYFFLVFGLHN